MKRIARITGLMVGCLLPLFSWAIPLDTGTLTLSYQLVPADATPVPLDGHWIIVLLLLVTTATVMRMRPELARTASHPPSGSPSKTLLKWLLIGAVLIWALLSAGMNSTWASSNLFHQINLKAVTNYFNQQYSYTINSNYSVVIPCDQLNTIATNTIPVVNDFDVIQNVRAPSLIPAAYAMSMSNLRTNVMIRSAVATCTQSNVNVSACVNQSLAPGASCQLQVSRVPN